MLLYYCLLGIDALVAAILLFFFADGIGDGTVSSYNAGIWIAILAGLAVVIGGGFSLRRGGNPVTANVLLAVLAIPAVLFGLLMGFLFLSDARWN